MRVAIASVERLFLDGLVALFSEKRHEVVVSGLDCRECLLEAKGQNADLFVFDAANSSESDLQFVLGAETFGGIRTILIAPNAEIPEGFESGIHRDNSAEDLLKMADAIADELGMKAIRGRGRPRMKTGGFALSPREYEVACLVAKGCSNRSISEQVELSEQSIKNLVSTVIRKLACENRVQVALMLSARSHRS